MANLAKSIVVATLIAATVSQGGLAIAATTMAPKPTTTAGKAPVSKGVAANAAANANLFCQIGKSGEFVTVQAINKGTAAIPAGTTFSFTIIGPKKKTPGAYKFKTALAAGKSVNVTKVLPAQDVSSCSPAS